MGTSRSKTRIAGGKRGKGRQRETANAREGGGGHVGNNKGFLVHGRRELKENSGTPKKTAGQGTPSGGLQQGSASPRNTCGGTARGTSGQERKRIPVSGTDRKVEE